MADHPLQLWQMLVEPARAALVAAAAEVTSPTPTAIAALRKIGPSELVPVAMDLAIARRKLVPKFGPKALKMVADPAGAEMASSLISARHKAARFTGDPKRILDLCSGIGGDGLGFAGNVALHHFDLHPVRAWMASMNTGRPSTVADVTTVELPEGDIVLDPARRDASNRRAGAGELAPGLDFITSLARAGRAGCIKLAPGIDPLLLPEGELEIISEDGQLTQAILWMGRLSKGAAIRTATLLERATGKSHTMHGAPSRPTTTSPPRSHLYAMDASIERTGLIESVMEATNAVQLHPGLGLLTSDEAVSHPFLTQFELVAEMPWDQRAVQAELTRLHAGVVDVKTRDKLVDPDTLAPRLSGNGDRPYAIFILRFGTAPRALITQRIPSRETRL